MYPKENNTMNICLKEKGGTFSLNKAEPIHRWYSYVEGYSSCLVEAELDKLIVMNPKIKNIYDPFCGTGTTALVASCRGLDSFYSESNPFMQQVIETKLNVIRTINIHQTIIELINYINVIETCTIGNYQTWNGFEKFFSPLQLNQLLTIKDIISKGENDNLKKILILALSSIVVKVSKMVRRGDLRYASEKEYKPQDVVKCFIEKLKEIIFDIEHYADTLKCGAIQVSEDARGNMYTNMFDCVITSPPYLNGTNYIRNTKLELKLNDYITTEKDIPAFHSKGIIAGINNVSKRTNVDIILPEVEPYVEKLMPVSYDERIPKMVAGYFRDMDKVISKLSISIKNGGSFTMDIGDSQFAGVHIPTHQILSNLCKNHGFQLYDEEILRQRRSKNGMVLSQRLLRYRLEK